MRWLLGGLLGGLIVGLTNLGMLSPSLAISCGPGVPGVNVDITGASGCGPYGNGNPVLATLADPLTPIPSPGYVILDTTFSSGPVPLTVTFTDVIFPGDANIFRTDGTFSFTPITGYTQYALGLQLETGFPDRKPDWFTFYLASSAGTFDSDYFFFFRHVVELMSDPIQYAVLYGLPCPENDTSAACQRGGGGPGGPTPLPGAVWLLGTVLAGGAGVNRWRKRKAKKAALVPA